MNNHHKNINKLRRKQIHLAIELVMIIILISVLIISYLIVFEAMSDKLRFDLDIQLKLFKKLINFNNILR